MKRLKVLFITGAYPTKEEPVGGVFIREHAKAAQLYNDVVILHWIQELKPNFKGLWQLEIERDGNLTEGILTYRLRYRLLRIPRTSYLIFLWSIFQAFRKLLKDGFRPDIIHANVYASGLPAVLIGKLYHIPVVISEHWSAFPRKLLSGLEIFKARFAFQNANLVLPVSQALQGKIEDYGIRAKFQVIPNAVNTNIFFPPKVNRRREKSEVKRILFVGLLVSVKGLPYFLEALAQLQKFRKDWHLDIVGDGPAKAEYERMSAQLGIGQKVTFYGLKSKSEVVEFMRNCDFFVQPSLYETFGAVYVEAMACGKPVIATSAGGPREIIKEKVGILVPPQDVKALMKAVDYMLDHHQDYSSEEISQFAKQNFSYETVGEKINDVYKKILKENL